ncbi:MAG: hypothetical protein EPO35_11255 [Acidobacteria bacterium]|nr:MAG: hypothetical protein EPO35_11255 [Acidobacteriota bacterium]
MTAKRLFSGKFFPGVIAGVLLLLAAGCATKTINHVLADPSRYRNGEVRLKGTVVDSYSIAARGAYQLSDGTGRLWIISSHGVPRTGASVKVTGRIREGANLGNAGGRLNLPPGVASGVVMIESSHKAKR